VKPDFVTTRRGSKFILTHTVQREEEIDPNTVDLHIAQEERSIAELQRRVIESQERLARLKEIKTEHEANPDA